MSELFEELKLGLEQAIDFEKGTGKARVTKLSISPIPDYSKEDIRDIRIKAQMSQRLFAYYLGVSQKTVEAWESGKNHPTGPACRLLKILETGDDELIQQIVR